MRQIQRQIVAALIIIAYAIPSTTLKVGRIRHKFVRPSFEDVKFAEKLFNESVARNALTPEELICSGRINVTEHRKQFGEFSLVHRESQVTTKKFSPAKRYSNRYALLADIKRQGLHGYGAELGVAQGFFSRNILKYANFKMLFSIDAWELGTTYHKRRSWALHLLSPFQTKSCVIWGFFSDAKDLFEDETLDFIYVDGFAHTGELEGQTFNEFYSKVRSGGVFGGHDYDERWPLVKAAVNRFAMERNLTINVVPATQKGWDCCDSWFVVVP